MKNLDSTPSGAVPQRFRYCIDSSERDCRHSAYPQAIVSENAHWVRFAYHCPRCRKQWTAGWSKDAARDQSRDCHAELLAAGLKHVNDYWETLRDQRAVRDHADRMRELCGPGLACRNCAASTGNAEDLFGDGYCQNCFDCAVNAGARR